ncbi:helix-turn-helix domain-containing protein [Tabrizicola sp.]|uniref:helix-turn-helix domain-containing protein n=1 Tax=Tabrizicola sp. TaxID=2005166 RepID=UPI003F3E4BD0
MPKRYDSLQEYHDTDQAIGFRKYEEVHFRVGLLSETSSDVTFTSTNRNGLVVDLSGTAKHLTQMDGILDETPTRRGDVCLIPPDIEARFAWETRTERQTSIILEFDSEVLAAYLPDFEKDRFASGHLLPANYADRPILANLARLLSREIDPDQARGRLFAESVMRLVAFEIVSSHWSVPMQRPEVGGGWDSRVKRAIEFIESKYSDDITLSDIGQASGLSVTQLTSRFQKDVGATPYSYVIDRRLRQAVHLLKTTEMPIAEVAVATGFSDQQHLTRAFRARLDQTPKQVRKA